MLKWVECEKYLSSNLKAQQCNLSAEQDWDSHRLFGPRGTAKQPEDGMERGDKR